MILGLEITGGFVAGVVASFASIYFGGRWFLRRRYGGLIDMLAPPK